MLWINSAEKTICQTRSAFLKAVNLHARRQENLELLKLDFEFTAAWFR